MPCNPVQFDAPPWCNPVLFDVRWCNLMQSRATKKIPKRTFFSMFRICLVSTRDGVYPTVQVRPTTSTTTSILERNGKEE
jgi:hypothetical protein